jgi:hypothetical protein
LCGCWNFSRTISNGSFAEGVAIFSEKGADDESLYREEGFLTTEAKTKHAFWKEYIYRLCGGQIQVFFKENPPRLFHTLRFGKEREAQGEHLCLLDQYKATYYFENAKVFSLSYQVLGPSKNYQIYTTFTKMEGGL